ncbi:MAG TPA: hypothetical protein VFL70_01090 [Bacteroidia bacterium]|nr:hypothetical protein [Bacteroidia bacterium]
MKAPDNKSLVVLFLFLCSINATVQAQEIISKPLEQKLEKIAEAYQNEDIDFLFITEVLTYYTKHPINLNNTNEQELAQLSLLNDIQISNLLNHINKNGKLLELYELQSIDGFSLPTIYIILPYIKISDDEEIPIKIKRVLQDGDHSLFTRVQQILEKQKGFAASDSSEISNNPNSRYLGSRQKIYTRYRFTYNNRISAGIIGDKDAGEIFFKKNVKYNDSAYQDVLNKKVKNGFDFYSAHLFITNKKRIKTIAIGDYQIDFGQGLTAKNTFTFGKSADVISIYNNPMGIRPHTSADENSFMRGFALTAGGKTINASGFLSKKQIDANIINTDSLSETTIVSSFQTTGLHTTPAEIFDKHSIIETVIGSNISYIKKKYNLGITGTHTSFNSQIQKTFQAYNLFQFRGKEITNAGMNYNLHLKNINLFGEASLSSTPHSELSYAFLNGCIISIDSKVAVSVLHRNFKRDYQNLFTSAFAETAPASNEKGIYCGINITPIKTVVINAYCDHYSFPWLKYNVNAPSYGNEYFVQINYTPNKNFEAYLHINNKKQLINSNTVTTIDFIAPANRINYRWNLRYIISPALTLRNRIEFLSINKTENANERGYLIFQDIIWNSSLKIRSEQKKKLSLTLRYAVFGTSSYDSRIYAYESDIPGSFSIPSYYYNGSRVYTMINWSITNHLDFWIRFSQTYYTNKNKISPNTLNEINGDTKSEIKVAIKIDF